MHLGKRKVATKSRVLHPHFSRDANFTRDFAATSLSLPRYIIYYSFPQTKSVIKNPKIGQKNVSCKKNVSLKKENLYFIFKIVTEKSYLPLTAIFRFFTMLSFEITSNGGDLPKFTFSIVRTWI